MDMDLDTLKLFEAEIAKHIPGFSVKFKDESTLCKVIGFLTQCFNPKYMTKYTTTLAPSVYFPSRAFYERQPNTSFTTLAHEFVHLYDNQRGFMWELIYTLPQALAILPLLLFFYMAGVGSWVVAPLLVLYLMGCMLTRVSTALFWVSTIVGLVATSALSIWVTEWASAALFASFTLLAPWPSIWRSNAEMRGYAMNIAVMRWTQGSVPEILKRSMLSKFTTSTYYFMSWSGTSTYAKINAATEAANVGTLASEEPYSIVWKFLSDANLLKV